MKPSTIIGILLALGAIIKDNLPPEDEY